MNPIKETLVISFTLDMKDFLVHPSPHPVFQELRLTYIRPYGALSLSLADKALQSNLLRPIRNRTDPQVSGFARKLNR